jgi:prepilin-type N-terminal cleavage/methylation domain-containing protein
MLKNKKGFTLVELLAVIVILAIILAIAVPGISSMIESSKESSFESDVKMLIVGIEYDILEAQTLGTAGPAVHVVGSGADHTAEVANYGGDPANYSYFEITSINPVTVSVTAVGNSKFGKWQTTGATRNTVSASSY